MIRPIELQMLYPRTESVGNTQQHEIQHNINVNANAANEVVKQEQRVSESVVEKDEKDFDAYQYDASQEGKGAFSKSKKRKKKNEEEESIINGHIEGVEEKTSKDNQPRINFDI